MTGGEIVAAAIAAETIGKKTLSQDSKTKDVLLRMADGMPEMESAAQAMAMRIYIKERIKLKLIEPFAGMIGIGRKYFIDEFAEDMAAKTAGIPDIDMVTPPASIAIPTMLGLSYSADEPDLKEMYLNLLTTAADGRRPNDAHPAFAEVIKQLTSDEARLLNLILVSIGIPIVRVENRRGSGSYRVLMMHLANIYKDGLPDVNPQAPMWIDNWSRLGLIDVSYSVHMGDTYDWVTTRPEYLHLSQDPQNDNVEFTKGRLRKTDFGERFIKAVSVLTSETGAPGTD